MDEGEGRNLGDDTPAEDRDGVPGADVDPRLVGDLDQERAARAAECTAYRNSTCPYISSAVST